MTDRPQHSDPINLVKRVLRVNNYFFLGCIILPNILNTVQRPVDYRLQTRTVLFLPTRVSGLISRDLK